MITAKLSDGRLLQFPDGTDPAIIQTTVKKLVAPAPAPEAVDYGLPQGPRSPLQQPEAPDANFYKNAAGIGDVAATLGSAAIAEPLAGIAGLAKSITSGPLEGSNTIDEVRQALTWSPKTETGQNMLQTVGKAAAPVGQWMKKMEDASAESVYQATDSPLAAGVASAFPAAVGEALGLGVGIPAIKNMGKAAIRTAKQVPGKALAGIATKIDKTITNTMNKAIKPTYTKKKTAAMRDSYNRDANIAVNTIIDNKDKLMLMDESGTVTSRLPESLEDFQNSFAPAKAEMYKQTTDMLENADAYRTARPQTYPINKYPKNNYGKPLRLKPVKIIKELDTIINSKPKKDFSPQLVKYAWDKKETLLKRAKGSKSRKDAGGYTATEAHEAIQDLNQSLKAFYADPSTKNYGKAMVDAMIANNLREGLNKLVNSMPSTNKQFADIKQAHSALLRIESDIAKAANRIVNKATGLMLPDFTDIIAGHQIISGLVSGNPAGIAGGLSIKALSEVRKKMTNPNTKVKAMFQKVELLRDQAKRYGGK